MASEKTTTTETKAHPKRAGADDTLATLHSLMNLMAGALGDRCEIVLHDFHRPEHSIIAVSGNVTGRRPGGSVTQIGLAIMRDGDAAKDHYTYTTRAPSGQVLKSVTIPLRDAENHVFGALCINIDISEFWAMGQSIQAMIGANEQAPKPVTFIDDIDSVIGDVIMEETKLLGRPLNDLSRIERLRLLKALDFRGVFSLQRSIPQIADQLGVSRATLYNDLKQMRHDNGADGDGSLARAARMSGSKPMDTEGEIT